MLRHIAGLAALAVLSCAYPSTPAPLLGPVLPMAPPQPAAATVVVNCKLVEPPPTSKRALSTKPQGCPDQFAACLSISDAMALTQYLEDMQTWSREAWAKCGSGSKGR